MSYWIITAPSNREFLESLDITLGRHDGQAFRDCEIPEEALPDLMEVEGNTLFEDWNAEDQVCWDLEREPRALSPATSAPKVSCPKCRSALKDGVCTYGLCGYDSTKVLRTAARKVR